MQVEKLLFICVTGMREDKISAISLHKVTTNVRPTNVNPGRPQRHRASEDAICDQTHIFAYFILWTVKHQL